ncbi:MAG: SIR2 family protein, partial [Candidatus Acidiferrales bacterium]
DEKYADAISYYKMCPLIPEGEKYRELAAPFHFKKYDSTRLVQLVKLPFSFIVTTNYDRSLHDAWAKANGNAPLNFEYDDESLKQAGYCTDSFIARIHGRAERPDYMVADLADYAKLDSNSRYKDFLLQNVLVRQTCLFLGYSFVDPAIAKILDLLEKLVGPTYPKKHYALLPSTANRLQSRLAPFNIEVILYPNHDVLWKCIDDLPGNLVEAHKPIPPKPLTPLPFEKIRTFLASCYVRYKTAAAAAPLRDLVLQGIVLSLVEAEKPSLPVRRLIAELRRVIPLTETEASVVVSNAVRSLSEKGWVSTEAEIVTLTKEPEKSLDKNLQILVSGALSRLVVREAAPVEESYGDAVRQALEQIFLQRGSDLGAEFIGKPGRDVADVYDLLRQSLRGLLPNESFERMDRLARAVHDLLRRPDSREARVLSEVARLSFGLNVLLQSGSSALKFTALPERLYFDSNILLCAITDGHPFRPLYVTTFQKLEDATALTGRACELLVAEEFLNEIVSHRRLGIRMIKELGLEDPDKLEKHIRYYNAENTNVFVGAYASWVGRKPEKVSFAEFLEQAAPYDNEKELGRFMEKLGFRTVRISQQSVESARCKMTFTGGLQTPMQSGRFEVDLSARNLS